MGTLSFNLATPSNAQKEGNLIRMRIRDTAPSSFAASPSATLVITNAQLLSMCPKGELRALFNTFSAGLPAAGIAAGAITALQARALLLCDDPTALTLDNSQVPRAVVRITPRGGLNSKPGNRSWSVDANIDASGKPVLVVGCAIARATLVTATSPLISANDAYVEVEFCHSFAGR
jgi:hypothetical protein